MNLAEAYDREKFLSFLEDFLPDFKKDVRPLSINACKEIKDGSNLGKSGTLDLQIFELKHSGSQEKRVALTKDGFRLMKETGNFQALAVYQSTNSKQWRLSLMTSTPEIKDERVITKLSNPRRYSFLLGPGAKVNTPAKFLKDLTKDFEDLRRRFSVEVVNNEFYKEIAKLYDELVGTESTQAALKHPDVTEAHHEFAVRLIGRVIFAWFLREKHDGKNKPLITERLLSRKAADQPNYYQKVLSPLFFEVLNTPMEKRPAKFQAGEFTDVPYLNGGLFTPVDEDYYDYDEALESAKFGLVEVPDEWLRKFFDLLELYNFTVDENTTVDVDLSIDPEMLGRIFENLLARINPETGETVRKSTGSFYTPREIVEYMVDESLVAYLQDKTKIAEQKLRALVSYDLTDDAEHHPSDNEKESVVEALSKVTILDPACGSGAFPIGMLQKIVFILQQIDPKAKLWFERQIQATTPELRHHLEREYRHQSFDYLRKLGIIRESIFGVDIQPIATEIARLRCFLTLIVDERVDDKEENRGIEPLPNLDFKFVTANSLIPLPKPEDKKGEISEGQGAMFEETSHIDELKQIRNEYFSSTNHERHELQSRFEKLQKKMVLTNVDVFRGSASKLYDTLSKWDPFEHKPSEWFDSGWMFGISDGFNIVIANPPWVFTREAKFDHNFKDYIQKKYIRQLITSQKGHAKQSGKINLFAIFIIATLDYLKSQGQLVFILPNTLLRATVYDGVRKYLLDNTVIKQIVDLSTGRFSGVTASTAIIILEHSKNVTDNKIKIITDFDSLDSTVPKFLDQNQFNENVSYTFNIFSDDDTGKLTRKIQTGSNRLDKYVNILAGGIATGPGKKDYIKNTKLNNSYKPLLEGKDIKPYKPNFSDKYILYDRQKLYRAREEKQFLVPEKLVTQRIGGGANPLVVAYDNKQYYTFNSTNSLIPKSPSNISLKFICTLLNSSLLNWYYRTQFSNNSSLTVNISKTFLEQLPIKEVSFEKQRLLVELFNKAFRTAEEGSDLRELQRKIDESVYRIYDLTTEEIQIIEKSTHS